MTRKDFQLIANVLHIHRQRWTREMANGETTNPVVLIDAIADDLATELRRTNERFNRENFIAATQK